MVGVGGGIGMEEPRLLWGLHAAVAGTCPLLLLLLLLIGRQGCLRRLLLWCHLCKRGLEHSSRRLPLRRGAHRRGRLPRRSACCYASAARWARCRSRRLSLLLHRGWPSLGQLA